jgi:site-specific recombinase XerD
VSIVSIFSRGRSWGVRYTENGKSIRKIVGRDRRDAIKVAASIQQRLNLGKFGMKPDVIEISIRDLVTSFLNTKRNKITENSFKRYKQYLLRLVAFIEKNFPSLSMCHLVREVHIEECLQSMRDGGGSAKSANELLSLSKQMFNFAIRRGHCQENPAEHIGRYQAPPKRMVEYYTEKEMIAIIENSPQTWKDVFEFFYLTGIRNGELINLTWNNADIENRQITIQSNTSWRTKTGNVRVLPLNDKAVEILKRCKPSEKHNYVFVDEKGEQITRQHPRKILKRVIKRLGIVGDIHKIRHTFASHLVMKGEPLYNVSKLLGHTSIAMTEKYAHLAPEALRKSVDRL